MISCPKTFDPERLLLVRRLSLVSPRDFLFDIFFVREGGSCERIVCCPRGLFVVLNSQPTGLLTYLFERIISCTRGLFVARAVFVQPIQPRGLFVVREDYLLSESKRLLHYGQLGVAVESRHASTFSA